MFFFCKALISFGLRPISCNQRARTKIMTEWQKSMTNCQNTSKIISSRPLHHHSLGKMINFVAK